MEVIYDYSVMLDNIYEHINPAAKKKDIYVVPPKMQVKGKESYFKNFTEVAEFLKRDPDHLRRYMDKELSSSSSINQSGIAIFKGKFRDKNIEKVLYGYIEAFVQCSMCDSLETTLEKDEKLVYVNCNKCKATRYVE